jgi:hypothetical protein
MSTRTNLLKFPANSTITAGGNTGSNCNVTPPVTMTVDEEYPIPGPIPVGANESLILEYDITAISGTIQFFVDSLGTDGVYYPIYTGPVISTTGLNEISIGPAAQSAAEIGNQVQLRWAVTGGTPSTTLSLSLIGN